MRLHSHAASANCLKIRCLAGVLDLDLPVREVDIFAGETLTDSFAALNPLRETPVLELDDGSALAQSSAILQLLAEGTSWAGRDALERAQITAWCCFEQEHVVPGIGGVRFRLATRRATAAELDVRRETGRAALDVLEHHLSDRRWLVGDRPTIADVAVWAYAHLAPDAGLRLGTWPAVTRWCRRAEAVPGWRDDLRPYAANAAAGVSRSIYD